jgi:PTH2 family peptidyl-tRNA hydrolase
MSKQVIIIRKDLKMRRGKEIAQGSHASMAFITRRMQKAAQVALFGNRPNPSVNNLFSLVEWEWIEGIFAKVVCQVQSEEEIRELYEKALAANLEAHLIVDSGKTEFGGVPTVTALAIGPDVNEKIDPITKDLKLY